MATVHERDGIHVEVGRDIVADARSTAGDINIVSHAHSDHITSSSEADIVCTDLTRALAAARSGADVQQVEDPDITLHPSGHILGSAAARIEHDDRTYLYTGDVATRDRAYMDGFEPVEADELIIETTYGRPDYVFPPQEEVEHRIRSWIGDNEDRPLFLCAYSLGKAQKVQWLARQATDRRIIAHGAVHRMNAVIEDHTDHSFDAVPYQDAKDDIGDDIIVLPPRAARADWAQELMDDHDGLQAGFSGWATKDGFMYRGGHDETFVLSDHCDHDELLGLVEAVDPDQVYTQHGFAEPFARTVKRELRTPARPLQRGQSTLDEF